MRPFSAIVALANISAVLGVALAEREERKLITIVFELGKINNEAAIEVWDEQKTTLLAQSCATALQSGPLEQDHIAFDFDDHGSGNFTVGTKSFIVSDNPALNQEASCGRIASAEEHIITCRVPFASGPGAAPLERRAVKDCFPKSGPLELLAVVQDFDSGAADEPLTVQWTVEVGNGNPTQNPLNIQLSDPVECGHAGCSVSYFSSRSVSWSVNAGITVYGWISVGFAVQQSGVETGNYYQCNGGPWDYFSVFRKQGQTAYTVQNQRKRNCGGSAINDGGPYVIWSPNANNIKSWYYCVYSREFVRWNGYQWLDASPNQPGGPR
ncbi:hypothetical protein V8F33_004135 [Rhypophila sp. PSN 637]